jgi:hypothetical protein
VVVGRRPDGLRYSRALREIGGSSRSVGEPAEGSLPSSCPLGRDATLVYQTAVALAGTARQRPQTLSVCVVGVLFNS